METVTENVRDGLISGSEPDIADLFLLDADQALYNGRFREAVLICWSTIDAVFNRRYEELVNDKLEGEWSDARKFFTGTDFGLRHKMTAVMHLVANRSLYREPGKLWERLSVSYRNRNEIIHSGALAVEDDAHRAIGVAREVVAIMRSV